MKRRPWTEAELGLLRCSYADSRTDHLATALGRSITTVYQKAAALGLQKSSEYLVTSNAGRIQRGKQNEALKASQFKAGLVPWNKGAQYQPGGRSVETRFEVGRKPQTWKPIGTYQIDADGLLRLKVKDVRDPPKKDWVYAHRQVWEAANGPIPAGYIVRFKDGRKTSDVALIVPDALELITRVENMRRNTYHRYGPEIARTIQLRGALSRQINKRTE